jgi:hypothetical protein
MSDEEVDELLKGFPVQYVSVYLHLFVLIHLCSSLSCSLSPLFVHRWSLFGDAGQELIGRDGQINYHSFVRSILAQ